MPNIFLVGRTSLGRDSHFTYLAVVLGVLVVIDDDLALSMVSFPEHLPQVGMESRKDGNEGTKRLLCSNP